MREDFVLRVRPFSINASTYRDARIKTQDYREWSAQVLHLLNTEQNLAKMQRIREYFDENKHSIKLEICAIYPRTQFITEAGILSSRTIDVTNFEKLCTDLFFDKQYFAKPSPYGVKNLSINDKHVVEMISKKTFHDHEYHELQFNIIVVPRAF